MPFETERAVYHANLEDLLAHEGHFVVIKGDTIGGTSETYEDVLELGYEQFGVVPFLVKKIRRGDGAGRVPLVNAAFAR